MNIGEMLIGELSNLLPLIPVGAERDPPIKEIAFDPSYSFVTRQRGRARSNGIS